MQRAAVSKQKIKMEILYSEANNDSNNDRELYAANENNSESETETSRNTMKFPTVARECDRYGVSDVAEADIATGALKD